MLTKGDCRLYGYQKPFLKVYIEYNIKAKIMSPTPAFATKPVKAASLVGLFFT